MANFPNTPIDGVVYSVNGVDFLYRVTGGVGEFVAQPVSAISFLSVASIAELRTKVFSAGMKGVLVTNNNLGLTGAFYVWNATSTSADDGCLVVKVTSVTTGRWLRVLDGVLDSRSFGWPSDGTAVTKMRAAAVAQNPDFASATVRFALPKNSTLEIGQIHIGHGFGGDWSTGNNSNMSFGQDSLINNTTGYSNTVFGYETGKSNTTGYNLTAFGRSAGQHNTDGINNTAFGVAALQQNTSGNGNTAVGTSALVECTVGINNTAIGFKASFLNDAGSGNTSVGTSALLRNTANDNTAVGYEALTETLGASNTGIGRLAGANITTGSFNTSLGAGALFAPSTGNANTVVGANAMQAVAAFSNNVAVGYEALRDCTVSGNTAVGYQAGISSVSNSNCTFLGNGTAVTASNQVQLGNSATTTYVYGTVQNRSDARDKADIVDTQLGLDFINSLRPVDYVMDYRDDYRQPGQALADVTKDGSKKRTRKHHGFLAQEIPSGFGGYQDHSIVGGEDVKSLGYDEFIAPMVKAIQELTTRVKQLEAERDNN
jgi:parallel beta-helix repeat protein